MISLDTEVRLIEKGPPFITFKPFKQMAAMFSHFFIQ